MTKLYKIGEVAELCNLTIRALRYYEELGLITPSNVDIYTGYRYYDEENIKKIKQIVLLKNLNFTLDEIKNFDENAISYKEVQLENEIKELKRKLRLVSSLKTNKGEIVMNKFINDERVVGKWVYEATAFSKEKYLQGDFYKDDDALYQVLCFLPQGKGYWVFDGWTKGELIHGKGVHYKYEIENGKLFLQVFNVNTGDYYFTLVYNKENSKEYTATAIEIHDNINIPFENDERVLGVWQNIDWVKIKDLKDYKPKVSGKKYWLQKLTFLPNGDCVSNYNDGSSNQANWTKNFILSKPMQTASKYEIKNFDGEDYLFVEWKASDYIFTGKIYGLCCLKRVK